MLLKSRDPAACCLNIPEGRGSAVCVKLPDNIGEENNRLRCLRNRGASPAERAVDRDPVRDIRKDVWCGRRKPHPALPEKKGGMLMAVAVVSRTGVPLMPTSPYRARKLLASGKAEKYGYDPFTIRLTERETGDTQPVELCMDTGYIHIGVSVKSEKHEYLALQIDTLTDEKKKHEKCREKRRNRRSRKRYRKPRFDNRKRDKGWLAPSLEHKKEIHVQAAERICRVSPVTDITMEMGNFDTQVLKAKEEGRPLPQGTDYQQGERYGTATLREAVFSRDNYTCLRCGRTMKDGAYFHVHHIRYRSQGGTDRMANLATVCEKCHTPANHQPGGKLYNWKPEIKSFKGATFMTAVRWQMYREIKEKIPDVSVHLTYGAATKERRRRLQILRLKIFEYPRKQTYDQPVDQSFHRKIEDILSFRNKKSEALGNLHNMICHALMDHLTESGKPPAEVAKSNKRVHACIRRSAYS